MPNTSVCRGGNWKRQFGLPKIGFAKDCFSPGTWSSRAKKTSSISTNVFFRRAGRSHRKEMTSPRDGALETAVLGTMVRWTDEIAACREDGWGWETKKARRRSTAEVPIVEAGMATRIEIGREEDTKEKDRGTSFDDADAKIPDKIIGTAANGWKAFIATDGTVDEIAGERCVSDSRRVVSVKWRIV